MMLAYMGQACLGMALVLAGLQALALPRSVSPWKYAYGQTFYIAVAFALLTYAHVTDQFALLSVALHSHTAKPLLYKFSGVWGNHEGSMLLWVFILSGYGAFFSRQVKNLNAPYSQAIPLLGIINFGFLLFLMMACDPFAVLNFPPAQGQDMNPLLQDPSLAIHPPCLYLGYAGFVIPFILSILVLIQGNMPDTWAPLLRPWVLFAWMFLTLGAGLGSFWAYYELGWGGWWFWDPVENVALMPWLTATALVHTVCTLAVTKTLRAWTLFLSILTFALCLGGTFLVRSGLVTSVHAFALDPERGVFLLALSSFLILPALGLLIWRGKSFRSPEFIPLPSRQGLILLVVLILMSGTATVALGTLYPLILEAFGQKITVGAPYFNATFIPMMLPLLMLLGLSLWYTWKPQNLSSSTLQWLLPLFCLTVFSTCVAYFGFGLRHILGLTALMGSLWAIFSTLGYAIKKKKILSGTIFAHLGFGVAVLGMVGSSLGEKEVLQVVKKGESFALGPVSLTLQEVTTVEGPNYRAQRATLQLSPKGPFLAPEKRFYGVSKIIHGESAIQSIGWGRLHHIYVTLGEEYEGEQWSIHAYYKPFINLLWIGILCIVWGGILACLKRFRALNKLFILLMILVPPTLGIDAHEQLARDDLEARARQIGRQILCPTCQGQTLDESPVEEAVALRYRIRVALSQGQTNQQIIDALIAEHGKQIMLTPPVEGTTYGLWLAPWILFTLMIGFYITQNQIRKRERKAQ